MSRGKIGLFELMILGTLTVVGTVFLQLPAALAQLAEQSGWLGVFLGAVPGFLLVFIICWLATRFPDQTPAGYSQTILGPFLGRIMAVALSLVLILIAGFLIRDFSLTLSIGAYPQVPVSLTMFVFLVIQAFLMYWGLEVISRVAVVFLPYIFISPILITVGNVGYMNFGRLLPLLGAGLNKIAVASYISSGYFSELFLMAIVLPRVRQSGRRWLALSAAIVLAAPPLAAVAATSVAVFGVQATSRLVLPAMELARVVNFGEALQRLESVFVIFWMFGAIIKVGIFMWSLTVTLAETLRLNDYRILIPSVSGLVYVIGMLTQNYWDQATLRQVIGRYLPAVLYGVPLLLAMLALILRKGVRANGPGRQQVRSR